MDEFTLKIFVDEIKKQSFYSLLSYDEMVNSLNENNLDAFWYFASSFLSSTANVSKLLGGNNKSNSYDEREQVRDHFKIQNDDLIIHTRDVRNAFDHYDSRIKMWSENVPNRIYISNNIGAKGGIFVEGLSKDNYMRNFEPQTGELSVLNESINVYEAVEELKYFYNYET